MTKIRSGYSIRSERNRVIDMSRRSVKKGIHRQLLLSYIMIIILMILVGISAIYHVKRVYNNGDIIYEDNLKAVDYLKTLNTNVREIDQYLIRMIKRLGSDSIAENKEYINVIRQENIELMSEYERLSLTSMENRRYNQCRLSFMSLDRYIDEIIELTESGEAVAAVNLYEQELMPVEACTYELIDAAAELASRRARLKNDDNKNYYYRTINIILFTTLIIAIFGVFISIRMSNSFTRKLKHIQEWASGLSEYNVSNDIKMESNDEFSATAKALNDSQFMIRELIGKIIEGSTLMSETGNTMSESIRKVKSKVENINLTELEYEEDGKQLFSLIKETMRQYPLNEEMINEWNEVLARLEENIELADDSSKELMNIATILEQIGITADYHNEIVVKHKEQIDKFTV